MGADPGLQLFAGEGRGIDTVAGPEDGDEQMRLRHLGGVGIVDRHLLAGPVDEELLTGDMQLSEDRFQGRRPGTVEFAIATVPVAVGLDLPVLLPEQLQGDALAAELFVDRGPVGQRLVGSGRATGLAGGGSQELFLELGLIHVVGQGPGDLRRCGAFEIIPHGADRQTAATGNLANREVMLMSEPEDFFDGAHG